MPADIALDQSRFIHLLINFGYGALSHRGSYAALAQIAQHAVAAQLLILQSRDSKAFGELPVVEVTKFPNRASTASTSARFCAFCSSFERNCPVECAHLARVRTAYVHRPASSSFGGIHRGMLEESLASYILENEDHSVVVYWRW